MMTKSPNAKNTLKTPNSSNDTAYIIVPYNKQDRTSRDLKDIVEEAEGLARAISLQVAKTRITPLARIHAGAFFGSGTRKSIAQDIEELKPAIIIVNHPLSPVQQRNLEREWKAKVIDRTGLILEIFGARAQTKEGRLQVELAALEYQKSRLVRSWTHLERQRGGAGFMGGPGERQIELDRRSIAERIDYLKADLEKVRRTRELGRKSRERVPYPIVSLVGYTNAGKSTLFNTITKANVFAEDLPFATLDPTLRRMKLPNAQEAILSDTVGFIADLPTHLVASFRATLEQITHASVIVHVVDASKHDYKSQKQDVINILKDLGIDYTNDERIIEVYNKADRLEHYDASAAQQPEIHTPPRLYISALKGQGIKQLLSTIARITSAGRETVTFKLDPTDGKALAWLYANGEVLKRKDSEKHLSVTVSLDPANLGKFRERFAYKPLKGKRK